MTNFSFWLYRENMTSVLHTNNTLHTHTWKMHRRCLKKNSQFFFSNINSSLFHLSTRVRVCYLDDCFILAKICFLFSKLWKHSEKHSPYNSFSLINTQFTGRAYLKKTKVTLSFFTFCEGCKLNVRKQQQSDHCSIIIWVPNNFHRVA